MNEFSTEYRCSVCNTREVKWMDHEPEGCDEMLRTNVDYLNHMTIGTPMPQSKLLTELLKATNKEYERTLSEYSPPDAYYVGGPYMMTTYNPKSRVWECNHGSMCEQCIDKALHEKERIGE